MLYLDFAEVTQEFQALSSLSVQAAWPSAAGIPRGLPEVMSSLAYADVNWDILACTQLPKPEARA